MQVLEIALTDHGQQAQFVVQGKVGMRDGVEQPVFGRDYPVVIVVRSLGSQLDESRLGGDPVHAFDESGMLHQVGAGDDVHRESCSVEQLWHEPHQLVTGTQ
jgi:hypothetical protein